MKIPSIFWIGMLILAVSQADGRHTWYGDPDTFAAIAYSPSTGRYGYSYNYRSRSAAEKAALEHLPLPDARIVCWVQAGICALALGDDKSVWGVGWIYGNGARTEDARKGAVEDCGKRTTHPYLALLLLSDGQLVWDHGPADPAAQESRDPAGKWQTSWDAFLTLVEEKLNRLPPDAAGPWEGKDVSWEGTVRQIEVMKDKSLILALDMPRRELSIKGEPVVANTVFMFVPVTNDQQSAAPKARDRIRVTARLVADQAHTLYLENNDAHGRAVSVARVKGKGFLVIQANVGTILK
jgi:hypothetical protein